MNEAPRRWVDSGEDPALSDALQGAPRPRSRSDVERERTAHRVARISLGLGAVGAAWGAGKTAALAAALLGVTAATVTLATRTSRTSSAPSTPSASITAGARHPRASASSRPAPVASAAVVVSSAPVPSSPQLLLAAPSVRRAAPTAEPRVRSVPAFEPGPMQPVVAEPSASVLPANIPTVVPTAASAEPPSGGLTREVALLHEASAALERSPSEALAVCDRHAREFPTGALEDERELLAVQALTRMGSLERARTRGEAFLARRPSSVHAARMRRVLASPTP